MTRILFLCLVVIADNVGGQCNFPLNGTWVSSSDGTWTVNSSHLLDFKVTDISGYSTLSFLCFEVQGSLYVLQSIVQIEVFNGVFRTLYTCLDLRYSTSGKFIYYKNTDSGSTVASEMTIQSTFGDICNKASYDQPYYHHVALLSGSEGTALINCPPSLFGSFSYDTCTDPTSNSTSMNVCDTRQQLVYNYTVCSTEQMFSADGVLDCVYYIESGAITYLTVYNRDSTNPDSVNYFRFSCLTVEESGSTRLITASPEQCVANQNASAIDSPGQAIQFVPYYLCLITTTVSTSTAVTTVSTTEAIIKETSNASTNIGLILGIIAVVIVLAIIVALILFCCCLRKRRRRKKVDEEKAIAEDTDDQRSQRSEDRRGSSSSSQDEDKRSVDSGIGREPLSGRATGSDYKRLDDQEQEEEVEKTVGELDVDDKSSRPRSGQDIPKESTRNPEIKTETKSDDIHIRSQETIQEEKEIFNTVDIVEGKKNSECNDTVKNTEYSYEGPERIKQEEHIFNLEYLADKTNTSRKNTGKNSPNEGFRSNVQETAVLYSEGNQKFAGTDEEDREDIRQENVQPHEKKEETRHQSIKQSSSCILNDFETDIVKKNQFKQDHKKETENRHIDTEQTNTHKLILEGQSKEIYNETGMHFERRRSETEHLIKKEERIYTDEYVADLREFNKHQEKTHESSMTNAFLGNENVRSGEMTKFHLEHSHESDFKKESKNIHDMDKLVPLATVHYSQLNDMEQTNGSNQKKYRLSGMENPKNESYNNATTREIGIELQADSKTDEAHHKTKRASVLEEIVQRQGQISEGNALERVGSIKEDFGNVNSGENEIIAQYKTSQEDQKGEEENSSQNDETNAIKAAEQGILRESDTDTKKNENSTENLVKLQDQDHEVKTKDDADNGQRDDSDIIKTAQRTDEESERKLKRSEDDVLDNLAELQGDKERDIVDAKDKGDETNGDQTNETNTAKDADQYSTGELGKNTKNEEESKDTSETDLHGKVHFENENMGKEQINVDKEDVKDNIGDEFDRDSKGGEQDEDSKQPDEVTKRNIIFVSEGNNVQDKLLEEDATDSKTEKEKNIEDGRDKDQTSTDGQQSDTEDNTTKKKKRKIRNVIGLTSDGEEIYDTGSDDGDQTADDDDSSLDDAERERRNIGRKKGIIFTPAGPLTTVLVSRQDEERRRNKLQHKSKKQKMRGLAKKKTSKHSAQKEELKDAEIVSSEDEEQLHSTRTAPFMVQYRYKKRIENKLEEEQFWKDPNADKDPLQRNEETDSLFGSKASSFGSEKEDENIENQLDVGPDGVANKQKKSPKHRNDTVDISVRAIQERNRTNTSVQKANSDVLANDSNLYQTTTYIVSHNNADENDTGKQTKEVKHGNQGLLGKNYRIADVVSDVDAQNDKPKGHPQAETDVKIVQEHGKTRLIHVKEHRETHGHLRKAEIKTGIVKEDEKSKLNRKQFQTDRNDFMGSDYDKQSDSDSGVEEEEVLDVILTGEQQQMIVNALFDADMRLRPEFGRDENGRIIRKLNNTVIYDPHTGRFTFRRRLGRLFNVPRLKRNKKGRPTGGYVEDDYGPKITERQISGNSRCSRREMESGLSLSDSPIYDKKSRGDGRNVGFSVPDDDLESVSVYDLEFKKRGRRDIGSGIRRKLKNRLFRKKQKRTDAFTKSPLPEVHLKRAWTSDTLTSYSDKNGMHGDLSPVLHRRGGPAYSTPGSQRKAGADPQQWQKYREGLECDRRILAGLQDNKSDGDRGSQGTAGESFAALEGESNSDPVVNGFLEDEHTSQMNRPEFSRGPTYWSEDGRFIVRERGCPELQTEPLFTIIRRPGDTIQEELSPVHDSSRHRSPPKSAPVPIQTYDDHTPKEHRENEGGSSENCSNRSMGDSQLTYIDDNRLRRLLEELYRDKKYFDQYVETTEPQSEVVIHTKGLAEHGRGYLLERADYWEKRGPLPPRPPLTEIGWKMHRQQTMMDSARMSEHDSTTTVTPEMRPYTVPGYVDSSNTNDIPSPRDQSQTNYDGNESFV